MVNLGPKATIGRNGRKMKPPTMMTVPEPIVIGQFKEEDVPDKEWFIPQ